MMKSPKSDIERNKIIEDGKRMVIDEIINQNQKVDKQCRNRDINRYVNI